jgi:hypothetical protein
MRHHLDRQAAFEKRSLSKSCTVADSAVTGVVNGRILRASGGSSNSRPAVVDPARGLVA